MRKWWYQLSVFSLQFNLLHFHSRLVFLTPEPLYGVFSCRGASPPSASWPMSSPRTDGKESRWSHPPSPHCLAPHWLAFPNPMVPRSFPKHEGAPIQDGWCEVSGSSPAAVEPCATCVGRPTAPREALSRGLSRFSEWGVLQGGFGNSQREQIWVRWGASLPQTPLFAGYYEK